MCFFAFEIICAMVMIIFTPVHSVILFNLACFIGGSGIGGLFIMVPLFIAQDFGKTHFGVIWGVFLFGMEFGIWLFSMIVFDGFYEKYNKDKWGRCTTTD